MEAIELLLDRSTYRAEFGQSLPIEVGQFTEGRHLTVEVLLGEDQRTIDEVTEDSDELIVIASLEVLPRKVIVLGLGSVGREHIAKDILLTGEILQILIEPYGPVAGGRDLVPFEVEELVGGDILGQDIRPFGTKHSGEDDTVEDDIVLADEVQQAGIFALPPLLPAIGE